VTKSCLLGFALIGVAALGAMPLLAQPASPGVPGVSEAQARAMQFETSVVELAKRLNEGPPVPGLSRQKRTERVEFVAGNVRFVANHELAHALVAELKLPVLGREEDTADVYAILKALRLRSKFSDRTLVSASKAWFVSAGRGRRRGESSTYYERHSLDEQRAYQIICLMVGFDPTKFKALADAHKLPEDRRQSCGWDFDTTAASWDRVMAPYLRAAQQPKTTIEVNYGEAAGSLVAVARVFREIRFLETLAEFAAETYLWPAPIKMEMRTCGYSNASWTNQTRTLLICYEMVEDFAQLFRELEQSGKPLNRAGGRS